MDELRPARSCCCRLWRGEQRNPAPAAAPSPLPTPLDTRTGPPPARPPPPACVTLTTLAPDTAVAGSVDLIVTATGSGYTTSSVVKWNGVALTTNYVSATSLTATVPAADLN